MTRDKVFFALAAYLRLRRDPTRLKKKKNLHETTEKTSERKYENFH